MQTESVQIPIEKEDAVSGELAIPDNWRPGGAAAVFAHGAANDMNHPLLVSVAESFAEAGCLSLRFNFLYRELGKKSVDTERRLSLAWERAIGFLGERSDLKPGRVVAVGKSLGGRIASQMAAEGTLPADALIFLGYPLHAPGKTDKLRNEHLGQINLPMLFFLGTRDPFGEAALMKRTAEGLSQATLEVVPDGDHSLGLPKTAAADQESVYQGVAASALEWLRRWNLW
jgi:predicted alpha/beta-hydrolase family hydrolase